MNSEIGKDDEIKPVEYIEKNDAVLVNRIGSGIILTITPISSDELEIQNWVWGTKHFVKTTLAGC